MFYNMIVVSSGPSRVPLFDLPHLENKLLAKQHIQCQMHEICFQVYKWNSWLRGTAVDVLSYILNLPVWCLLVLSDVTSYDHHANSTTKIVFLSIFFNSSLGALV